MDSHERWEGDPVETTPFLADQPSGSDNPPPSSFRKIWNRAFSVFVAITLGVYAGLVCDTVQEAWIYSALFFGEALVCACIAGVIQTPSFRKSITAFAVYFIISAVSTPIACWIGLQYA
jgi:hypothetical protein